MPSPSNEPSPHARLLARAARECRQGSSAYLGDGLPQALSGHVPRPGSPGSASLAFVEVHEVSPTGVTALTATLAGSPRVIGLSASPLGDLGALMHPHEHPGVQLVRLICSFAVFDFDPRGPVIVEVAQGLTAADVQARLATPLFAGPDLQALSID